jgi:hypothetical protein
MTIFEKYTFSNIINLHFEEFPWQGRIWPKPYLKSSLGRIEYLTFFPIVDRMMLLDSNFQNIEKKIYRSELK